MPQPLSAATAYLGPFLPCAIHVVEHRDNHWNGHDCVIKQVQFHPGD